MQKVLLLIEDYNELLFSETLLKKIGVDCLGMKSDAGIADEVSSFRPDLVIISDYGPRIKAASACLKVKKVSPKSSVLVLYRGEDPSEDQIIKMDADGAIKSPFHPKQLLDAVGHMTDTDPQALIAKFEKLSLFKEGKEKSSKDRGDDKKASSENLTHIKGDKSEGPRHVSGQTGDNESAEHVHHDDTPRKKARIFKDMPEETYPSEDKSTSDRQERFAAFLKNMKEPEQKQLPKSDIQKWTKEIRRLGEQEDNVDLDEKRRDFVRALYKK